MFQGKFFKMRMNEEWNKSVVAREKRAKKSRKTMINRTCSVILLSFYVMFFRGLSISSEYNNKIFFPPYWVYEKKMPLKGKVSLVWATSSTHMRMMCIVQSAFHEELVTLSHAIYTRFIHRMTKLLALWCFHLTIKFGVAVGDSDSSSSSRKMAYYLSIPLNHNVELFFALYT